MKDTLSMRPKKLLIVYPKLVAGGEERLIVDHLEHFDRSKTEPYLCLLESGGKFLDLVPEDVPVFALGKKSWRDAGLLVVRLARLINSLKPDIVLSSLWYSSLIVSLSRKLCGHRFKFIAREPHNHKRDCEGRNMKGLVKRGLMGWAHRDADLVVTVSRGAFSDISRSYGIPPGKMRVIYNSVDISTVRKLTMEPVTLPDVGRPRVVTLGRLIYRKGFDRLIRSFGRVRKDIDAELVIIGHGPERERLESLARDLGLERSVRFLGYQANPYSVISRSQVFVLSSLWEGFGNVIIESMACGVPVVATRCPYGPEEIVTDDVNGLLVPVDDEEAMAAAIKRVLSDGKLREKLAAGGNKRAEDFGVEKAICGYENIFAKSPC